MSVHEENAAGLDAAHTLVCVCVCETECVFVSATLQGCGLVGGCVCVRVCVCVYVKFLGFLY